MFVIGFDIYLKAVHRMKRGWNDGWEDWKEAMEDIKIKSYKIETMDFEKHKKILGDKHRKKQSNQWILKYMNNAKDQYPCPINGSKFS